jgi:hypothetical protein
MPSDKIDIKRSKCHQNAIREELTMQGDSPNRFQQARITRSPSEDGEEITSKLISEISSL